MMYSLFFIIFYGQTKDARGRTSGELRTHNFRFLRGSADIIIIHLGISEKLLE
jgi:hypothetical protein